MKRKPLLSFNSQAIDLFEVTITRTGEFIGYIKQDSWFYFLPEIRRPFNHAILKQVAHFIESLTDRKAGSQNNKFDFKFVEVKDKELTWKVMNPKSRLTFGRVSWDAKYRRFVFITSFGSLFGHLGIRSIIGFIEKVTKLQKEGEKEALKFLVEWFMK